MGDPAATKPSQSPIAPLPKPPGRDCHNQAKPRRHVSFSDLPPRFHKSKKGRPKCCSCCVWTCIVLVCLLLALILIGALFIAFIQSQLPEFRIESLNTPRFDIVTVAQQSFLNADVDLFIEFSNNNKRVGLFYGPMRVEVSTENINLGQIVVPGFSQTPKNVTVLRVRTGVTKFLVDNEDGARLKSKFSRKELVLDVMLTGTANFLVGKFKMTRLPITVVCGNMRVATGIEPKCRVKMFNFGGLI